MESLWFRNLLQHEENMESNFNKQTSDGLYTFTKSEVFEALTMWCAKKGINLKDKNITSFDCIGGSQFTVELAFNGKEINNAASTQKPTP
jgi:hypothetical protein